ncbi:adhesin, partial [Phyllobacterium salinisoli]
MTSSSQFVDLNGDATLHRTAWAGKGTGVLIYDADGNGAISNKGEFAFTQWAPSAASDLEALRIVFDTNHDGKLDADDARWSKFKVIVDGKARTLDELGITSIDLTAKGSGRNFTDGSSIIGTTTFTRSDGTTGTVGDAVLTTDPNGYRIKTTSTTEADGNLRQELRGFTEEDGRLAFIEVTTTSADGKSIRRQYDDDANGTMDRSQTEAWETDADGTSRRTITNFNADGSPLNRTIIIRSADGVSVTTQIDQNGDGIIDQDETVISKADGSSQTITNAYGPDGGLIQQILVTPSADGLSKTIEADLDGDGVFEQVDAETTIVDANGRRTKTVESKSADGTPISATETITSADNRSQTVSQDYNGDGVFEETETALTEVDVAGTITTTISRTNTDASLRNRTITVRSGDGLSQTISTDWTGDGVIDRFSSQVTTVDGEGVRTKTIEEKSGGGTLLSRLTRRTSADGKTITIEEDRTGDGVVDGRDATVVNADGITTRTETSLAADGKPISQTVTQTSADGLSTTVSTDMNGDGSFGRIVNDMMVANADGSRMRTVSSFSGDNKLVGKTVTTTSADSLTQKAEEDLNGDSISDRIVEDVIVLQEDGSRQETVTTRSASGVVLSKIVTAVSADRKTTTRTSDTDGDGQVDLTETSVIHADGSKTTTGVMTSANGTMLGKSVLTVSKDGLTSTRSDDLNGDGTADTAIVSKTLINSDGSQTRTVTTTQGADSNPAVSVVTTTTSADGLCRTTQTDMPGSGTINSRQIESQVINADGTATTTLNEYVGTSLKTSESRTVSDTQSVIEVDADGNGKSDWKTTVTKSVAPDGTAVEKSVVSTAVIAVLSSTTTTTSADGRTITIEEDRNGDGSVDWREVTVANADGSVTQTVSTNSSGGNKSTSVIETSADGLSVITSDDIDGNGSFDRVTSDITVVEADGKRVRTITETGTETSAGNAAISGSSITVSADGLTKSTAWSGKDVVKLGSSRDVTTMHADGSISQETSYFKADGSLGSSSVKTTSGDGRTITTTIDLDGDGKINQHQLVVTNADGSVTSTLTEYAPDGVTPAAIKINTKSGDGLTETTAYDLAGKGVTDEKIARKTTLNADGGQTQVTETFKATGEGSLTLQSRATVTTSRDGLAVETDWENIPGSLEYRQSDVTVLNADGSRARTTSFYKGDVLVSSKEVTTDATGLQTRTRLDSTGTGKFEETTDVTTLGENGTRRREVISLNPEGSTLSHMSTDVSADGTMVETAETQAGYGGRTHNQQSETRADGTVVESLTTFDSFKKTLSSTVTTTCADKRDITISRDANGDGQVDQVEHRRTEVDGSLATTITGFGADGKVTERTTERVSRDRQTATTQWDFGADGRIDRQRTAVYANRADGSQQIEITDTDATGKLARKTTIGISADGQTQTTKKDINGNGTIDQMETAVIDVSGRRVATVINNADARTLGNLITGAVNWSNAIAARVETTTSADGLTVTVRSDFDDDGTFEHVAMSKTRIDGSVFTRITETNADGTAKATGTIERSADGLMTVLNKDGNNDGKIDRTETSVVRNDGSVFLTASDKAVDGSLSRTTVDTVTSSGRLVRRHTNDGQGRKISEMVFAADKTARSTAFDPASGEILSVTDLDAIGLTTSAILYDPLEANPWSRVEQSFKAGKKISEKQFNNDGTRAELQFEADTGKMSSVSNFAADGRLVSQLQYDANGVTTSAILHDPLNANPWSRVEQSFKAGKKTSEKQFNDDGTRADVEFVADSGRVSVISNFAADGRLVSKIEHDAKSANSWLRIETLFDAQGRQMQKTVHNDDGSRTVSHWDTANTQPWSTLSQTFNSANQLTVQKEVKDDGSREDIQYDPANINPWAQINRISDSAGRLVKNTTVADDSTRQEITYDAAGQATSNKTFNAYNDQIGENGIIDTDVGGDPNKIDGYTRVVYNTGVVHYIMGAYAHNMSTSPALVQTLETKHNLRLQFRAIHGAAPVAFDLNGDGRIDVKPLDWSVSAPNSRFDWNGDGVSDQTAWVGPNDGMLVIDLATDGSAGPDGQIDQTKEIAFSLWKT